MKERRNIMLERTEAYRRAKEALDGVVAEVRSANDPGDFLADTFDALSLLKAAECGGAGHGLVYLVPTPWGGVAVAAYSANPLFSAPDRFSAFDLPSMTDTFTHDLIQVELGTKTDQIIGGFAHAQLGSGLSLLEDREWLAAHEEPKERLAVLAQDLGR